jgi:hypothetical protein
MTITAKTHILIFSILSMKSTEALQFAHVAGSRWSKNFTTIATVLPLKAVDSKRVMSRAGRACRKILTPH